MNRNVVIGVAVAVAVAAIGGVAFFLLGNSGPTPLEFNNQIVEAQAEFIEPFLDLSENIATYSQEEIDAELASVTTIAKDNLAEIQALTVPAGGEELHEAAIELFEFYVDILENDYKELIEIATADPETWTEEDFTRLTEISLSVGQEEQQLDRALEEAQKDFAEANNFEIEDNALQDRIDSL